MNSDPLFAIAYQVMPELRAEHSQILREFWIRAFFVLAGLVWSYTVLRRGVGTPTNGASGFGILRSIIAGIGVRLLLGAVPGFLFWCFVEVWAGGYWLSEAIQDGAEREILLGGLGLLAWSFVLGDWLVHSLFANSSTTTESPSECC